MCIVKRVSWKRKDHKNVFEVEIIMRQDRGFKFFSILIIFILRVSISFSFFSLQIFDECI